MSHYFIRCDQAKYNVTSNIDVQLALQMNNSEKDRLLDTITELQDQLQVLSEKLISCMKREEELLSMHCQQQLHMNKDTHIHSSCALDSLGLSWDKITK